MKYIHRLNAKDTPTTNIDKAMWYLNCLEEELQRMPLIKAKVLPFVASTTAQR